MILHYPPKPRGWPFLLFLVATFVFASAISCAQESQSEDVVKVSTDLLLFHIRVRDKQGQFAAGLTEQDLTLKDEDRVTTGLYLSSGADRVALLFALDQSGSLRELISQQRNAALALFEQFGKRSSVAVLRFSARPELVASFGRDMTAARAAFVFSEKSNQATAIIDAALAAVDAFRNLPLVRAERRIVILLSDGLDTGSIHKVSTVIESANRQRTSFYVIHLPLYAPIDGRLEVRPPVKGFRELAKKTGGKYFLAKNSKSELDPPADIDLTPIFQSIEQDLKSQYLLGFYLGESANDGRKHEFSLSLPAGLEYQVGPLKYSRTHEFFVNRPREALQAPR